VKHCDPDIFRCFETAW